MSPRILASMLALALLVAPPASASARFSGEEGTRAHRVRLSAGEWHTCAIADDGTVRCWGRNNHGQLGDGTLTNKVSPVVVSGLGTAVSIAAGSFHTCAVLSTAVLRCWGLNDSGQLGNGTFTSSTAPVANGLTNVVSVAAGFLHTCALRIDGSVWCWGAAMADGLTVASPVPVKINIDLAVSITAGNNHSCALRVDGTVRCWGQSTYGQLGYGLDRASALPQTVLTWPSNGSLGDLTDVVEVSAGGNFTCARLARGSQSCWGDNSLLQLGTLAVATISRIAVTSFAFNGGDEVALATGAAHTCAIWAVGTVFCFGLDDALQLGYPLPARVTTVPGISNAIEITAGAKHTCAAIVDGTIHCWGDNTYGQHGDGTTGLVGIDTVLGIGGTFLGRGVTVGNQFPCGRRGTGTAACWGAGALGQLGNATSVSSPNPVTVDGLVNAIAVTTGGAHACAIDATGSATCWGDNSRGQLGNGTTTASNLPVPVQGALRFVSISAGDDHTCGVTSVGTVYCWGAAHANGRPADSPAPVQVDVPNNNGPLSLLASAVAAGSQFTCALLTEGTVKCWGDNSASQLGLDLPYPVADLPDKLPVMSGVINLAAGADHACAVTAFGQPWCWGGNARGQIGNNSTTNAPRPVAVAGIGDALSVSAGGFYTCVVQAASGASCWGGDDGGQLGTKDGGDHLMPTPVAASVFSLPTGGTTFIALTGVAAIATGANATAPATEETCALLVGGVIRCWGDNAQGGIGNGTTVDQPRPTAVNSFAANVDPNAMLHNRQIAIVTALVICDVGDEAHIVVTLDQNGVAGSAHESVRCDGSLMRVPMRVTVHGRSDFRAGAATAHLEAIVHRGREVVDDTHWSRALVLSEETRREDARN